MSWEILLIFDLLDFMVQSSMGPCFTKLWTNGFHWWSLLIIFSLAYPSFFRFSFWSFLLKFWSVWNDDVTYVWLSDYMTKLFWSFLFYMFRNGVLYILYIQRSSDILIAWSIPNVTPLIIKLPHDSIFLLSNKKCALYIPISSRMWISLLVHMVFKILPKTLAASANLLSTLFVVFERIILKKVNSPIFFPHWFIVYQNVMISCRYNFKFCSINFYSLFPTGRLYLCSGYFQFFKHGWQEHCAICISDINQHCFLKVE